jgi:hypothetical protein
VVDQYIAGKYAEAGQFVGDDTTPIDVGVASGDTNAYEQLIDLGVKLDNQNIPREGRWVIIPPWYEGALLKDQRFVNFGTPATNERLMNAMVKRAAGFDIIKSNNVATTGGLGVKFKIMAGHSMAITFAETISEVEAYRPEKRFADAVKGLMLYGSKTVRPNALVTLTATNSIT